MIRRFLTFLARMGLTVRDDPKKVVDVAGRTWGTPVNGFALSIALKPREDREELATVSVAIQNRSTEPQRLATHGWLDFFEVSVTDSNGVAARTTPYGSELMKPERRPAAAVILLAAGEAVEADIPIGSIFEIPKGGYRVRATCETPGGGRVTSNEIQVQP